MPTVCYCHCLPVLLERPTQQCLSFVNGVRLCRLLAATSNAIHAGVLTAAHVLCHLLPRRKLQDVILIVLDLSSA